MGGLKPLAMTMLLLSGGAASAQPTPTPQMQVVRRPMQVPPVRVEGTCTIVPMRPSPAAPVVEVTINGRGPYRFLVETGAQGHGRINAAVAEAIGLTRVGEVRAPGPGGTTTTRPVWGVDRLAIGAMTFRDVQLIASPVIPGAPADIDGMLGIDLFRQLILAIDFGNRVASFRTGHLEGGVEADFASGLAAIPIDIAGRSFRVHVDTGNAAAPLFLLEEEARSLALAGPPVERGRARTIFGEFALMEAPLAVPVTVGGAVLPVHSVSWPAARGIGNLGSPGLAGMLVEIDRQGGRVAIRPSAAPPACPSG